MQRLELSGKKFGRWTVLGFSKIKGNLSYWNCECSCGRHCEVEGSRLNNGKSLNCRFCNLPTKTHGLRNDPLYKSWNGIITRSKKFNREISEDWLNVETFFNWLRPKFEKGYHIHRLDNTKGYTPDNCVVIHPVLHAYIHQVLEFIPNKNDGRYKKAEAGKRGN